MPLGFAFGVGVTILVARIDLLSSNDRGASVHRTGNALAERQLGGADRDANERQNDGIFGRTCS